MAASQASVRVTANFESNLARIASWWAEQEAPHAYLALLEELRDTVVPNLARHLRIGRRFFARAGGSIESRERVARIQGQFSSIEVREVLSGDYLVLYGLTERVSKRGADATVHLLAIRHHGELSFDFHDFWRASRGLKN